MKKDKEIIMKSEKGTGYDNNGESYNKPTEELRLKMING